MKAVLCCRKYDRNLRESPYFFFFIRGISAGYGSIISNDYPQNETEHPQYLLNVKPAQIISKVKDYVASEKWEHIRRLHGFIIEYGLELDVFICSNLIHTYATSGSLYDAFYVFNNMYFRDTIVWNSMMKSYANHGYGEKTLDMFNQMLQEGLEPSKGTIVIILKGCGILETLDECKKLHLFVIWSGFSLEMHVESCLIEVYGKCNDMSIAFGLFESMNERDVVVWNSMMLAYCERNMHEESIAIYEDMKQEGVCPNDLTVLGMLKVCTKGLFLKQGKYVHSQLVNSEYKSHSHIMNTLVDMYAKCHCLKDAREIFEHISEKSIVSWNVMLMGYTQEGLNVDAIELYEGMHQSGVDPDYITYTTILKSCASLTSLGYGKQIHALIIKHGFETNISIGNALIEMYAACHSIDDALVVFNSIEKKDISVWNALASAYSDLGYGDEVLNLFNRMQQEKIGSDTFLFVIKIKAYTKMSRLDLGKGIHIHIIKSGLESNNLISTSLIDMYAKHGNVEEAQHIFENLSIRDVVSWTSMISAYFYHDLWNEASTLFNEMRCRGLKPDRVTFITILKICGSLMNLQCGKEVHKHAIVCGFQSDISLMNTIMDMYMKCESIDLACKTFQDMSQWNVVSWNILIAGFVQEGHEKEALELFEVMSHGFTKPDTLTFVSALRACSVLGSLEAGRGIHAQLRRQGEDDVSLNNTLIDMYAKCGCIDEACRIFDEIHEKNKVTWNVMIAGYAQHGLGQEAIKILLNMKDLGFIPDDATVSPILSACSHEGLKPQGYTMLYMFIVDSIVSPTMEHYSCVVDMLGRLGCLIEAQEFVQTIPVQPNVMTWMTLLGTCKYHANDVVGQCAFASVMELEPKLDSAYLLLDKIFAACSNQ